MAFRQPPAAWCILFAAMVVIGLAVELINAALEALLDRLHPSFDAAIGDAKDMGSAAAFVVNAAAIAAFCGALLG